VPLVDGLCAHPEAAGDVCHDRPWRGRCRPERSPAPPAGRDRSKAGVGILVADFAAPLHLAYPDAKVPSSSLDGLPSWPREGQRPSVASVGWLGQVLRGVLEIASAGAGAGGRARRGGLGDAEHRGDVDWVGRCRQSLFELAGRCAVCSSVRDGPSTCNRVSVRGR
jgi:hypothetical protein